MYFLVNLEITIREIKIMNKLTHSTAILSNVFLPSSKSSSLNLLQVIPIGALSSDVNSSKIINIKSFGRIGIIIWKKGLYQGSGNSVGRNSNLQARRMRKLTYCRNERCVARQPDDIPVSEKDGRGGEEEEIGRRRGGGTSTRGKRVDPPPLYKFVRILPQAP